MIRPPLKSVGVVIDMSEKNTVPPKKGRPARGGADKATREEILYAAAALIAAEGYAGCTMRSISDRVRIKAGSLYYYFKSKDEIIIEIMNVGTTLLMEDVSRQVAALPDSASFDERLRTAIRAHAACNVDRSTPFMRVYQHLPPVIKRQARVTRKAYSDFWITFLENGKVTGDVADDLNLAIFVPYLLTGLSRISDWFRDDHMDIVEVADVITDSLLVGIRQGRVLAEPMLAPSRRKAG